MAVSQHHRQSKNSNLHFKEQKLCAEAVTG